MSEPLVVSLAAAVSLYEAATSLAGLALRPSIAFQVLALKRATAGHYADFTTQTKACLLAHCDRDTSGNPIISNGGKTYRLSAAAIDAANAEIAELGAVLVAIANPPRFVAADFPDTVILTAETLEKLAPCLAMVGSVDAAP